jgi:hypothetical protein
MWNFIGLHLFTFISYKLRKYAINISTRAASKNVEKPSKLNANILNRVIFLTIKFEMV